MITITYIQLHSCTHHPECYSLHSGPLGDLQNTQVAGGRRELNGLGHVAAARLGADCCHIPELIAISASGDVGDVT